jgi:hypothetical protein
LRQSGLLALQIGLRELAGLRANIRKQLLLLACEGSGLLSRLHQGRLLLLGQGTHLRANLTDLASAGQTLGNFLLLGGRQSLATRKQRLLLSLRELANLSAHLPQALSAGHFLLNSLLLSGAERLAARQNGLLLCCAKTASGRSQLGLPSGVLLGGRDSLPKARLQSLRLLAKN